MYIVIDNYDSFVYNLAAYFNQLGEEIQVIRNDKIDINQLNKLNETETIDGFIISPGPKTPRDCGKSLSIIENFEGRIPILGVCLGHQIIGYSYGARIIKGKRPMHGKVTSIRHSGKNLFKNLISQYNVTRYHSLVVSKEGLPDTLQVDAYGTDGTIMAITHRNHPTYGVQFHPEAILTEYGHELLQNFCNICKDWRIQHEYKNN